MKKLLILMLLVVTLSSCGTKLDWIDSFEDENWEGKVTYKKIEVYEERYKTLSFGFYLMNFYIFKFNEKEHLRGGNKLIDVNSISKVSFFEENRICEFELDVSYVIIGKYKKKGKYYPVVKKSQDKAGNSKDILKMNALYYNYPPTKEGCVAQIRDILSSKYLYTGVFTTSKEQYILFDDKVGYESFLITSREVFVVNE